MSLRRRRFAKALRARFAAPHVGACWGCNGRASTVLKYMGRPVRFCAGCAREAMLEAAWNGEAAKDMLP